MICIEWAMKIVNLRNFILTPFSATFQKILVVGKI